MVVPDEERAKIILGHYHKKLCLGMGWEMPAVHHHGYRDLSQGALPTLPIKTPTPTPTIPPPSTTSIPHAIPSDNHPPSFTAPRAPLSSKTKISRPSTLSAVAEVDTLDEQLEKQLEMRNPAPVPATVHPSSAIPRLQPGSSAAVPSTPTFDTKRPDAGVLLPLSRNTQAPLRCASPPPEIKTPPFAYRGMHTPHKPGGKPGHGNPSSSKRKDMESAADKENANANKRARYNTTSPTPTKKTSRQRVAPPKPTPALHAAIAGPSQPTGSTSITHPVLPHHIPSLLPLRTASQPAISLQGYGTFAFANPGQLHETDYRSDSSSGPSPRLPRPLSFSPHMSPNQPGIDLDAMRSPGHRLGDGFAIRYQPPAVSWDPETIARMSSQDFLPTEPQGGLGSTQHVSEDHDAQAGPSNRTSQLTKDPAAANVENLPEATRITAEAAPTNTQDQDDGQRNLRRSSTRRRTQPSRR